MVHETGTVLIPTWTSRPARVRARLQLSKFCCFVWGTWQALANVKGHWSSRSMAGQAWVTELHRVLFGHVALPLWLPCDPGARGKIHCVGWNAEPSLTGRSGA